MNHNKLFEKLKAILKVYENNLLVVRDELDNYYLNTPITKEKKKGEFFGAVQIKKSYVAFHLMPIYYNPDLLEGISVDLKKRMQGKSCFNFSNENNQLIKELSAITKSSYNNYKILGKI